MPLTRRSLLLGAASLALVGCGAAQEAAPVVGRKAPDFRLNGLEGGVLGPSAYAGKPLVVNFFATWCIPCKQELPAFQAASAKYADKGLNILLVDSLEDPDDVAIFLGDLKVTLPAVVDEAGEITKTYRVRGLPSTFFVGKDGVIKALQLGALDDRLLEGGISKIV